MSYLNSFGRSILIATIFVPLTTVAGHAAFCDGGKRFGSWLKDFKTEARAAGISSRTIQRAFKGVTYQPSIIKRDRRQSVFSLSFLDFSKRLISKNRLQHGRQRIKKHGRTFSRIKKDFGVPAPVLTAFWGLETDFGGNIGNTPIIPSLATLAYDCRRPDLFRPQLMDALRLIEAGDLPISRMKGAWAGELGQTQFLPSDYYHSAIDYDGDGKRDLLRSTPDALASSANLLKDHGWKRGQPWLVEVRVPKSMPWKEAGIDIKHSRKQWAQWGIKLRSGKSLKADGMKASLLLPMGRLGPAFLAYPNFNMYLKWNESLVYTMTAAYFATRLNGAPPVRAGNGKPESFGYKKIRRLQGILQKRGHNVGGVDGKMGAKTRAAIKAEQLKYGLPADSYPSSALLRKMGG